MSYLKDEQGAWKWNSIANMLIILSAVLLVLSVAIFYEPSTPEVTVTPLNVTVNNYYTIDGAVSPLNTMGCHLLDLTSGEGTILVCRR